MTWYAAAAVQVGISTEHDRKGDLGELESFGAGHWVCGVYNCFTRLIRIV